MKVSTTLISLLLLLHTHIGAHIPIAEESLFLQASFEEVKARAAAEGKLFFVDFYADYCYNCKLMDETTFVDPLLMRYTEQAYLPIKVHLEDFDGITLQQTYGIRVLPTILVFNSSGQLIDRYEEALSGSQLLLKLKQHDTPRNRVRNGAARPGALAQSDRPVAAPSAPSRPATLNPPGYESPTRTGMSSVSSLGFAPTDAPASSLSANAAPALVPGTTITIASPATAPVDVATAHLFQFSVRAYPTHGYGIQIGVFGQYGNVLREVESLQRDFQQPVLVNISELNGQTVYNVILGSFETRRAAAAFRRMMRKQDYRNTLLKDLSQLSR